MSGAASLTLNVGAGLITKLPGYALRCAATLHIANEIIRRLASTNEAERKKKMCE